MTQPNLPRPVLKQKEICLAWCFGLVVLVLAVFHPVLHGEFLAWDDDINIYLNPHLNSFSVAQLKWIFTDSASYLWRYQPLCWLTWTVIHQAFGLNPFYYHLALLLFHAANSVLVFLLVRELLLQAARVPLENSPAPVSTCAGLAAMLWAIHPLRVETTAWAVELVFVQPLFFFLLALLCYVRTAGADESRARRGRRISLGLFVVSLLSYPLALGGFVAFVAMDIFPLRRLSLSPGQWRDKSYRGIWREKLRSPWPRWSSCG